MVSLITTLGTCRHDGIGSQLQAYATAFVAARIFGLRYMHAELLTCGHISSNSEKEKLNQTLFELFSPSGELTETGTLPKIDFYKIERPDDRFNLLYKSIYQSIDEIALVHCGGIWDSKPNALSLHLPPLRGRFKSILKSMISPSECALYKELRGQPVVHCRRGDVSKRVNMNRFLTASFYDSVIQRIRNFSGARGVVVISESSGYDLTMNRDVTPLLDASCFLNWLLMLEADNLFVAPSSYSYAPALFREQGTYFYPFWHSPMNNWIQFNA